MLKNVAKFLIQHRRGVNKMKKYLIIAIGAIIATLSLSGVLLAATTDTVDVTATVAAANREITVTETAIDWTLGPGSLSAHRFMSPEITVNFYGGNQTGGFKIRAYTDHAIGAGATDQRGYLANGANKLYLKTWCPNFGPRLTSGLTPNSNYFWSGYDFNGDGDKNDTGKNGTLAAGVKYSEVTLGFDINGDGDTNDIIEVAAATDDPETFVSDGISAKYWLGESSSYSWMAEKDTLAGYELKFCDDINPLASPFTVKLAADVEGTAAVAYTGTVTFDIVSRL